MKHSRRLAAAAVTAVISIGTAAPAMASHGDGPEDRGPGHHGKDHDRGGDRDRGRGEDRGNKGGDRDRGGSSVSEQRKVERAISNQMKALDRVDDTRRLSFLGEDDRAAVKANVASDMADLRDLAEVASDAQTRKELRAVLADLRDLDVSNYSVALNLFREADRTEDFFADVEAEVEAGGYDYSAELDEILALLDSSRLDLRKVDSSTDKSDLREVKGDLHDVADALADVLDSLDDGGSDDSTDDDDDSGMDDSGDDDGMMGGSRTAA